MVSSLLGTWLVVDAYLVRVWDWKAWICATVFYDVVVYIRVFAEAHHAVEETFLRMYRTLDRDVMDHFIIWM